MPKPKIIVTVGPSSEKKEILNQLKTKKVYGFRINLSHTDIAEIEDKIMILKKAGVEIIIDTESTQIRTGNKKEIKLQQNQEIKIYNKKIICDENNIFFTPENIIKYFSQGDLISVDFNSVLLKVTNISKLKDEGYIKCVAILGGVVGDKKGTHIDRKLNMPTYSEKDLIAIELAKKHGIKIFTLSFMRTPEDVKKFKELYPESIAYAKIETREALENLEDITKLCEGILIDRGDLSRVIPIEKMPFTQKYIINIVRNLGKEAFVATNTLEKMSVSLKPDRSEVNDIINTLLDGATGIVMTKETAVGNYPVETVTMLISLMDQVEYLNLNPNSTKEEIISKIKEKDYFREFKSGSAMPEPHGGKLVNRMLELQLSQEELNSMKQLTVDETVIMDVEQIALGSFSPLEGFMNEGDFNSVVNTMRLTSGIVWPIPIILQLTKEQILDIKPKDKIILKYNNESYAILEAGEIYKINKEQVIEKIYGTNSLEHPGVANIIKSGDYALGGKINLIKRISRDYKEYELTPAQTRRIFSENGWNNVLGFHTRNVPHRSHEFIQLEGLKKSGCDGLFVHPVVGKKKKGDFEAGLIIETYKKMSEDIYPKDKVVFSTFATFSRYGGPREAIFTALTRKNFGCSHFVVGRDHTGVKDFYHPNASHKIFDKFNQEELGIFPIKFDNVFFSDIEKEYFNEKESLPHPEDKKLHLSGTEARKILETGKAPPEWFMRQEISNIILEKMKNGEKVFVE